MVIVRNVYILDIDGSIMPSIFPNLGNDEQTFEERKIIIKEINQKGRSIELYPNFVKFLEQIGKDIIYLVTGRKMSNFLQLTLDQITLFYPVFHPSQIIFYPEHLGYTNNQYLNWKIHTVSYLLKMHDKDICHVIDDNDNYFYGIRQAVNPFVIDYRLLKIDSNEKWKFMLNG